jgi:hypothetical protein
MAASLGGKYLTISRMTSMLPNYCIKCGDAGAKKLRKTYSWHHPALYLFVFLSPIVYAIVAAPFSRKMALQISLCQRHAARRLVLLLAGSLLLLGAIPLGIALGGHAGVIAGTVGILGGLVVLVVASNTIRLIKVTDADATYTGLSEAFLERFPGK